MKHQIQFTLFLFPQKESCLHFIWLGFVGFSQGRVEGFKKQASKQIKQTNKKLVCFYKNLGLMRRALHPKCKLLNMQWLLFSVQNNVIVLGMTYKTFVLLETHFNCRQKVGLLCT